MNKLLLAAALLLSLCAGAQTIHKDGKRSYVNVQPKQVPTWLRTSATTITRLYVRLVDDNLSSEGILLYELRGGVVIDSTTTNYVVIASGYYYLSDSDYLEWDANNNFEAFEYVAGQADLNLVIID